MTSAQQEDSLTIEAMPRLKGLPEILTVKEVSEFLRIHPSTVYKLLHMQKLPGFRIGGDWRFSAEALSRWCDEVAEIPQTGSPNSD